MLFVCVHMCNTGGAVYMCLHVACCMREWANPKNPLELALVPSASL